ncbi:hypothetical protein GRF56_11910 [Aeromonas veronii]|uniref:hypothetical protein n=1 Tax=Aeromonas veronii TaxID=654 RepID=UPI0013175288|nr:hypothetical protein [Aeromonas veronii]QHC08068.1 hypothetical protein GRF56_11910 [Aeromonas veronii]
MTITRQEALELCEGLLRKELEYNESRSIWPSVNEVVRILLKQSATMAPVYEELCQKLPQEREVGSYLDALISSFSLWDEDDLRKAREDRDKLVELNEEISDKASKLVGLLREREYICNRGRFSCERETYLAGLIDRAGSDNHLYTMYLQDEIMPLAARYEPKYWPSVEDVLSEIAIDAVQSQVYALDAATEAGTSSRKSSQADALRAFLAKLEEYALSGAIPSKFRLSDGSTATMLNCITEQNADSLVTADYIKNFRHKERERSSKGSFCNR